jgi:hypothetical protein
MKTVWGVVQRGVASGRLEGRANLGIHGSDHLCKQLYTTPDRSVYRPLVYRLSRLPRAHSARSLGCCIA